MPEYHFETHAPVDLFVEFGKGHLSAHCTDTTESTVTVDGRGADEVVVEQQGNEIRVVEPRRGGFGRDRELTVEVTVPTGSRPSVQTGSADVEVTGDAGGGTLRSGSGDVALERADDDLRVETGSGDITVGTVGGDLRVKTGSGDLSIEEAGADLTVSTGSGDVETGRLLGRGVLKTGSGDVHLGEAHADLSTSTGSGDIAVSCLRGGRFSAKGASGSVSIGVPAGVAVWTDLMTVTGRIHSTLESAGPPEEGQAHVELRVKTVSGDIELSKV